MRAVFWPLDLTLLLLAVPPVDAVHSARALTNPTKSFVASKGRCGVGRCEFIDPIFLFSFLFIN